MSTQPLDAPSSADPTPTSRRTWLTLTACAGAAAGVGVVAPFVLSLQPSERAKAAGAPVEVDISSLKVGELRTVEWRGKPVWILKRDPSMLESLKKDTAELADPSSNRPGVTPTYAKNDFRSIKPEVLVVVGICSHLGCSPSARLSAGPQPNLPDNWPGGFLCPCHGSTFDLAGRVFKNKPAPDNLEVPPYKYLSDSRIRIGEDTKA